MPALPPSVDIFGVQEAAEDAESPVCAICHDPLSTAQTYTLPECQHTFHTHCILTWFRHCQGTALASEGEDAPCPYCMNRGVNNGGGDGGRVRRRRGWGYSYCVNKARILERERVLRRYLRDRPDAPGASSILQALDRLRAARRARAEAVQVRSDLRKELKNEPVQYFEAQHRVAAARRALYRKHAQYRNAARDLLDFPILPLIIPTPLDLN